MDEIERLEALWATLDADLLDPEAYSDQEILDDLERSGVEVEGFVERGIKLVEELLRKCHPSGSS